MICRVFMWKSGRYKGLGNSPWDCFHGECCKRLWVRCYPFMSTTLGELLTGPPTPKGEAWDPRMKNIVWKPTEKTLRDYIGTPYAIRDVLTINFQLLLDAVAIFRKGSGIDCPALTFTIDKIYFNKQGDVVDDESKPYLVGGLTRTDLSGALRDYAQLRGVSKLSEKTEMADGAMTVVVSDEVKTVKSGCLVNVLPILEESEALIYALICKLGCGSFAANARMIHASGDGHAANIAGLSAVKRWTTGTTTTILADCKNAQEVPFSYGTDGVQHDTKNAEKMGYSSPIKLPGHPSFQIDVVVMGLRGIDDDGALVKPGTNLHFCSYGGKQLTELFATHAKAVAWHVEFCHWTVMVLQRRDGMKTSLSVATARTGRLLQKLVPRHKCLAGPARFLMMIEEMWSCSRGVDIDDRPVTAEQNLKQYDRLLKFLRKWKNECCGRQRLSGTDRPRGGLTREQYSFWELNRKALAFRIEVARTNGYLSPTRPRLPSGAVGAAAASTSSALLVQVGRLITGFVLITSSGHASGRRRSSFLAASPPKGSARTGSRS